MTRDSVTPEPAPRKPLTAPPGASDPAVGISGCSGVGSGAQTGVQRLDPAAAILDTISIALNAAGYWLPADGKKAVADALLKHQDDEAEKWRRRAVERALALGRAERTLELVDATARSWADDHNGADCARAVLDALTAYPAKEQS